MCASPGGGIDGGIGFPISPGLMGATNHPSTPSYTSIGGQRKRRYAVRGAAPPPHCFLVRGVCGTEKRRYAVGGTAPTALFLGRAVSRQRKRRYACGGFGSLVGPCAQRAGGIN